MAILVQRFLTGSLIAPLAAVTAVRDSCRRQETVYSLFSRRGLLTDAERGIKYWKEKRQEAEPSEDTADINTLSQSVLDNLKQHHRAKASYLLKIFDLVQSKEDLEVAENVLLAFRKGFNLPRVSLPLAVVRACIRVDCTHKALSIAINKRRYGVFPSARVYNIIMDSYLAQRNDKGIIRTYNELLADECIPNSTSYALAVYGYMIQNTDSGYESAIRLSQECIEYYTDNRRSIRPYIIVMRLCLEREQMERVREVLKCISKYPPLSRFDINYRIRGHLSLREYSTVLSLLNSLSTDEGNLTVSAGVIDQVETALNEDTTLVLDESNQFTEIKELLERNGKIISETKEYTV